MKLVLEKGAEPPSTIALPEPVEEPHKRHVVHTGFVPFECGSLLDRVPRAGLRHKR